MNRFSTIESRGSFTRRAPGETSTGGNPAPQFKMPWVLRRIAPCLGAVGTLVLVGMALVTMSFTWLDWHWVTFLSGILGAAMLPLVSRSIRAEWLIVQRAAQLSLARQKLANETRLRTRAEPALAGIGNNIAYLHEPLPVMLACIDGQYPLRYHNRAFDHGPGAAASHLEGRHLREVVGNIVHDEWKADLSRAFNGCAAHPVLRLSKGQHERR